MFKRAIQSTLVVLAWAKEDTYSESLSIMPLQNDFNLLSFDFEWTLPKNNL
jgi:hypothetical protein